MVPARAHLIWLGPTLSWVTVFAAASAAMRGGFEQVIFHHTDELADNQARQLLERTPTVEPRRLEALSLIEQAAGPLVVDVYRELAEPAARANLLRLALLWLEGGVYLDADTVTVASLDGERLAGGFFCGQESLSFPRTRLPPWMSRLDPRALAKTALRDLCRRLPEGYRTFGRIEGLYRKAANNAVLGSEAAHPFVAELFSRARALSPRDRRRRYALGTHLLQAALAEWSGAGVRVLPPEVFYPLGPEISEHWFRERRSAHVADVISARTLVVHWYASVRVRERVKRIDASWVREHAGTELFSALSAPIVDELGW